MEMATGEQVYVEHIMHRPQVCCFLMEGKDNKYRVHGSFEYRGNLNGVNSAKGWKDGTCTIDFHDGVKYSVGCPLMIINNLITGQTNQFFIDHSTITDETNNLVGDLHYNPWSDNSYSGMVKRAMPSWSGLASKLSGKKKAADPEERPKRNDDVHITVYQKSDNEEDMSKKEKKKTKDNRVNLLTGEGAWLSYLAFEGEVVWKIDDEVPQWRNNRENDKMLDGSIVLPSDMMKRADIPLMQEKKWEDAENAKLALEEQQRKDRTLREAAEKRRKKK